MKELHIILNEIINLYGEGYNHDFSGKIRTTYEKDGLIIELGLYEFDGFNKIHLIKAKSEKSAIIKIKSILLKIIKENINYIEPSKIIIDFCSEQNFDILKENKSIQNKKIKINKLGEELRNKTFKEPIGCYSCFELEDSFKEIKPNQELKEIFFFDNEDYVDIHAFSNGKILVAWDWSSGDGTLYFKTDKIEIINYDCKKDSTWVKL